MDGIYNTEQSTYYAARLWQNAIRNVEKPPDTHSRVPRHGRLSKIFTGQATQSKTRHNALPGTNRTTRTHSRPRCTVCCLVSLVLFAKMQACEVLVLDEFPWPAALERCSAFELVLDGIV